MPASFDDQPAPELDFGLESESLLDFSDEQVSNEDVAEQPRATSPPVSTRTMGQQLHEVALRAAGRLGLSLPPPPSVQASLLDGEFYGRPPVRAPSPAEAADGVGCVTGE